jgi:acetoin utilization deacetylase AcuC-like enzyme
MQLFFDHRQLAHAPALELQNGGWTEHAEKPSRAEIVVARLGELQPARDFGLAPIERVHSADYLDFLRTAHDRWVAAGRTGDAIGYAWPVVGRRPLRLDRIDALLGRFSYDAGTPIAAGTWEAAYWSAQTALSALQ